MPVGGVGGSRDAVLQGQDSVQLLLVQTGSICRVPVTPEEPEAGRVAPPGRDRTTRQLLKADLDLLCYPCREREEGPPD